MNEKTKSEARGRDASLAEREYKWGSQFHLSQFFIKR